MRAGVGGTGTRQAATLKGGATRRGADADVARRPPGKEKESMSPRRGAVRSMFGNGGNATDQKQENVVVFESEPVLTLPKKAFPKLGKMKKNTLAVRGLFPSSVLLH
jgi:hypothetical protein